MMMTMVTMEEMFARCCPCTASVAMVTTMTTMMMIMVKMEEEKKMLICRNLSFQCFSGYCDNNDDDVVNLYLPFSATWL